ncbi:MAG: hypothetical protein KDB23_14750 [Planctomycetales bacterium]|nr:hypothetical protein [Planctomycetales bacterium]
MLTRYGVPRSIIAILATCGAVFSYGMCGASAAERALPIDLSLSRIDISPRLTLFGDSLAATPQFAGSLSTSVTGLLNATVPTDGGSLSIADTPPIAATLLDNPVSPRVNGAVGQEPGNLAGTIIATNRPVGTIDIPDLGSINIGTLESVQADVALRDVTLTNQLAGPLPLSNGGFDLSGQTVLVTTNADIRGQMVLRADTQADYIQNLAFLNVASNTTDMITSVAGSCSVLELLTGCSTRRITVGFATRYSVIDEPLANAASAGTLNVDADTLQMTLPIDVEFDNPALEGVLEFGFSASGQVVVATPLADADANGIVDANDFDRLAAEAVAQPGNLLFDMNGDASLSDADLAHWAHTLVSTYYGDANLDGMFDTSDLTRVFQVGKYETGEAAGWSEGDWSGDGLFTTTDLVLAFADGGYEQGVRPAVPGAVHSVPEPTAGSGLLMAVAIVVARRRCSQFAATRYRRFVPAQSSD